MKKLGFLFIFIISACLHSLCGAPAAADSFRFEGTLKCGESNVPGMVLDIFADGKKVQSKTSNRQGNFSFYLAHNKSYTIELIKKDYILQKIVIDTKVSDATIKGGGIEMAIDNEIPVFQYYEGLKTEIFDSPVLYYIYNEKIGFF